MITTNSSFPQIDRDAERRRALAKIYSLLISLVEKSENNAALPENADLAEKKVGETLPIQVEPVNEEISVDIDSVVSEFDADQTNNSVPLKSNIPS